MLAKYRGLIKSSTYAGIADRLNHVKGELESLKTSNGHLLAEVEILRASESALKGEVELIRSTLAEQSTARTDATIEATDDAEALAEAIDTVENGEIESGKITVQTE